MRSVYIFTLFIIGVIFVLTGIHKLKWFSLINRRARDLLDVLGLTAYRVACFILGLICFVVVIMGLLQK
jgi:hypothetical protein